MVYCALQGVEDTSVDAVEKMLDDSCPDFREGLGAEELNSRRKVGVKFYLSFSKKYIKLLLCGRPCTRYWVTMTNK